MFPFDDVIVEVVCRFVFIHLLKFRDTNDMDNAGIFILRYRQNLPAVDLESAIVKFYCWKSCFRVFVKQQINANIHSPTPPINLMSYHINR